MPVLGEITKPTTTPSASVRAGRKPLFLYMASHEPHTQLFDLQNDPHELTNLAGKPEHAAKVAEMTALLEKEMARYGDTAPLKVADPKPAAWTPPAAGARAGKKVRKKAQE